MDVKISPAFWDNEALDSSVLRLAALWIKTNGRVNLIGAGQLNTRLFAFNTGLPERALAECCEALGKGLVCEGKIYWVREHIAEQFGRGSSLARNHMSTPLIRALEKMGCPWLQDALFKEYPELKKVAHTLSGDKGMPSPIKEQSIAEQSIEEQHIADSKVQGEENQKERSNTPLPRASRAAAHDSLIPEHQPALIAHRMLAINALKHRGDGTSWTAKEFAAFKAMGLHEIPDEDFEAQIQPLAEYYAATASILREFWRTDDDRADFRRRDVLTLLNNFAGEVDRARAWLRFVDERNARQSVGRL